MKKILFAALAALAALSLGACTSSQTQPDVPVREAGTGTPPVIAKDDSAGTKKIETVQPPAVESFNPLKEYSIYFDVDKYDVSDTYIPVVRGHADYMKRIPAKRASVQGNTDERGSREYNLALGQKRSESVKRVLTLLGVADAQIDTVSFGEEKPRNPASTEAAYSENRRCDLAYAGE